MTEKPGLPTNNPESDFDLDAIIRADEEDKKKEDALLNSEKKKENNKKKLFIGVLSLAIVGIVTSLFIFKPFGLGDDTPGNNTPGMTTAPTASGDPSLGQGPGAKEKVFWAEPDKRYPTSTPLQEWQLNSADAYKNAGSQEEQDKAQAKLNESVSNYNISVPGVNSNLQTLPSRSNGFTDDPNQAVLPDGSLNPKYSYWTLEGFNENVNYQLQKFVNPVFGNWTTYQYASAKGVVNDPKHIASLFTGIYSPDFLQTVEGKPVSSWLPVYADWEGNDYGMGDQLLADPAPRWMGALDSVETTFKFDEATQTYTAHVTAKVTYVAWSQSQTVLKKTGVITFDVLPGKDEKSIRYMLSNSKLEITA